MPYNSDFLFAEHCLAGIPAAVQELRTGPLGRAERFMVEAGIESSEAAEIVRELWTDLLSTGDGKRPLLLSYQGRCALGTWLNRVALSRALIRKRTEERRRRVVTQAEAEGALIPNAPSVATDPAEEHMKADTLLREMLKTAIQRAFGTCSAEDFVLLFLLHAGALQIQELSRMFACDPKTVNSRAKNASGQVRFAVLAEINAQDPWLKLSFDDVLSLLQPDLPHLFEPVEEQQSGSEADAGKPKS